VKCSLLTLSTYIDGELSADRRAELDAHLVGCGRCSAGAATLREEKTRLGQLARVHVAPESMRLMLEQVGITGVIELPGARPSAPVAGPPPDQQPWQGAPQSAPQNSAALPWTPRRPASPAPAVEPVPAPAIAPDVQPDLPFTGMPEQRSWSSEPVASQEAEPVPDLAPAAIHTDPVDEPTADIPVPDHPWVEADVPVTGWERERGDDLPGHDGSAPTGPAPIPPAPIAATVPTRAPTGTGSMLWARVRDAVTVRLALSRHGDTVEDSILIVSGATPPRGRRLPPAEIVDQVPDIVAVGEVDALIAAPADPADVELTGVSGVARRAPIHQPVEALVAAPPEPPPAPPAQAVDDRRHAPPAEPVPWNAFGASSYPPAGAEPPPAARPPARPMLPGRHSRAVAREQADLATRMRRAFAAVKGLRAEAGGASVAVARRMVTAARGANPDRRMIAAIAAVAIIFITALVIGHRSTPATSPAAGRAPAAAASAHASTTPTSAPTATGAPATSAPAAATTLPGAQTFGAGGTGFQVRELRYGQQAGYLRMVFDMGPAGGSSGTSPTITVAFTNPTTMLVTFKGTLPAGSTGNPPVHGVISSVTLVSSNGANAVYRIVVTRAVTPHGLFLSGTSPPLRFVLDLH
jgi:anti-sigma factor RsiW